MRIEVGCACCMVRFSTEASKYGLKIAEVPMGLRSGSSLQFGPTIAMDGHFDMNTALGFSILICLHLISTELAVLELNDSSSTFHDERVMGRK